MRSGMLRAAMPSPFARRVVPAFAIAAAISLLAGCGTLGGKASATANLAPTGAISPNPTMGRVTFTALDHGSALIALVHDRAEPEPKTHA